MTSPYKKSGIVFPRCTDIIADCTNKDYGFMQWAANCAVEWIKENCPKPPRDNYLSGDDYCVSEEDLDEARFAHKDISKQACDIGSEVHNAIEKYLKRDKYALTTPQAKTAFSAFRRWEKDVDLKPAKLEQTVWGDRWAGTLDFLGYYKGKLYVIDWKTSKAFYPEMRYQVAAYRSATQKDFKLWISLSQKIEGCGILRLDKETGMPKWKDTSKTYEQDLIVWNAMLDLYFARHPRIRARFKGR